jgi:UDP-N-acetylmuramoyl-L-alanyl-D-glutamate--2,6-diaminopimelate ligase
MYARPQPGHRISLRRLLPEAEFVGADDIGVEACACDSRAVRPGDLFAAIVGSVRDGHDFVAEALTRGCGAVLAQRPLPQAADRPVCYVRNTRRAYGRVCQALAGDPSRKVRVIGITGTNGKTTTSYLTASVLRAAGCDVGILGTLGCFDGAEFLDSSMTTPPPAVLADRLARMAGNGCSHAVMEVSSHALAQDRVAGIEFDVACVTNVRRDHLDYHGSARDYRRAKAKLFGYLAPEGLSVLNADDPVCARLVGRIRGPALTVAIRAAAEITATPLEQSQSEQTFLLTAGSETVAVRTRMIGRHHVYNCLCAAATGLAYGIDLVTVVRGLEAVDHLPGRLERIECGQPFAVFVDFAHTPDALAGSLDVLREVTRRRVICVFGAGGDRDRQKRPAMARAVEARADYVVLTNDNPRTEDPQAILDELCAGLARPHEALVVADRAEAIALALSRAQPGDSVLIAGKGHETCQVLGQQRIPFDDREVARQWLYEFQPFAPAAVQ